MNDLPSELVELVIEFAWCDKFVLVDDSDPVWVWHAPYKGYDGRWYWWDDYWGAMDPQE